MDRDGTNAGYDLPLTTARRRRRRRAGDRLRRRRRARAPRRGARRGRRRRPVRIDLPLRASHGCGGQGPSRRSRRRGQAAAGRSGPAGANRYRANVLRARGRRARWPRERTVGARRGSPKRGRVPDRCPPAGRRRGRIPVPCPPDGQPEMRPGLPSRARLKAACNAPRDSRPDPAKMQFVYMPGWLERRDQAASSTYPAAAHASQYAAGGTRGS